MTAVICLDNNNGMLFGGRRQSRDREVISDIMNDFETVTVTPFSKILFEDFLDRIIVTDNLHALFSADSVCFVENINLSEYEDEIDKLIIYRWNRNYPHDFDFALDLSRFELIKSVEFQGYSHDKITKEVYVK